jgi:cation:H+ antiporter
MVISFFLVAAGFAALIFGANWLVMGASSLAKKYRVSDLAIGLTIVAFGTSAPELVVNSIASSHGYSDIVLGNVIGSNNFNLFIILGIAGMILPISVQSSTAWREIPISFVTALLLVILANDFFGNGKGVISRVDGGILIFSFGLFIYYVYRQMKTDIATEPIYQERSDIKIWALIVAGLAGLVIGGHLVVEHSVEIAKNFGVSEKIIGLTIIAAGTSLPELVTSVVAAFKKNSDIAIGNVIGSNIFNILLILSISSFISPVTFNKNFNIDLALLAGGTLFLFVAMFTGQRKKLDRWEAGLLFSFYFIYTIYLIWKEI